MASPPSLPGGKEKEQIFISNFVTTTTQLSQFSQTPAFFRCVEAAIFVSPILIGGLSYLGYIPPEISSHLVHSEHLRQLVAHYEESLRQKKRECVQSKLASASLDHGDIVQYILVELALDHYRSFELSYLNLQISKDNSRALTKSAVDLSSDFVTYLGYEREPFPLSLLNAYVWLNDSGLKSFGRTAKWLFTFGLSYDFHDYDGRKVTEFEFYTLSLPIFRLEDKLWARRVELENVTRFLDGSSKVKRKEYNLQFIRLPLEDELNVVRLMSKEEVERDFEDVTEKVAAKGISIDYFGLGQKGLTEKFKSDPKTVENPSGTEETKENGQQAGAGGEGEKNGKDSGTERSGHELEVSAERSDVDVYLSAFCSEADTERRESLQKLKILLDHFLSDGSWRVHEIPPEVRRVVLKSLCNEHIEKGEVDAAIKAVQEARREIGFGGHEEPGDLNKKEKDVHGHLVTLYEGQGIKYPDTARKLKIVRKEVTEHSLGWSEEIAHKLKDHLNGKIENKKMTKDEVKVGLEKLGKVEEKGKAGKFPSVLKVIMYALRMVAEEGEKSVEKPDWCLKEGGGKIQNEEGIEEIRGELDKLRILSDAAIAKGDGGLALEPIDKKKGNSLDLESWGKVWSKIGTAVEIGEKIAVEATAGSMPFWIKP